MSHLLLDLTCSRGLFNCTVSAVVWRGVGIRETSQSLGRDYEIGVLTALPLLWMRHCCCSGAALPLGCLDTAVAKKTPANVVLQPSSQQTVTLPTDWKADSFGNCFAQDSGKEPHENEENGTRYSVL
jgi:hypothetical protein